SILNFNITIRVFIVSDFESAERNHLSCQILNPYRLAHVQQKHVAPCTQSTRLNYQLRGLRNGHKETGYFWISHGNRPALGNLLFKQRHDRARRTEYITKAHNTDLG